MKEDSIVRDLKKKISALPVTCIKKLWSTAMNRDIDILIVTYGLAGFYEIKVPGKQPDEWQYNRLAFWAASGADTGWFDDANVLVQHVRELPANFDAAANTSNAAMWLRLAIDMSNKR